MQVQTDKSYSCGRRIRTHNLLLEWSTTGQGSYDVVHCRQLAKPISSNVAFSVIICLRYNQIDMYFYFVARYRFMCYWGQVMCLFWCSYRNFIRFCLRCACLPLSILSKTRVLTSVFQQNIPGTLVKCASEAWYGYYRLSSVFTL